MGGGGILVIALAVGANGMGAPRPRRGGGEPPRGMRATPRVPSLPFQLATERARATLRPSSADALAPARGDGAGAGTPALAARPAAASASPGSGDSAAPPAAAAAGAEHVLCVPLYAVLCDPEPEVSLVAFGAAHRLWPREMAACAYVPSADAGIRRHQPGVTAADKRRIAAEAFAPSFPERNAAVACPPWLRLKLRALAPAQPPPPPPVRSRRAADPRPAPLLKSAAELALIARLCADEAVGAHARRAARERAAAAGAPATAGAAAAPLSACRALTVGEIAAAWDEGADGDDGDDDSDDGDGDGDGHGYSGARHTYARRPFAALLLRRFGVSPAQLEAAVGAVRAEWWAADPQGWAAAHVSRAAALPLLRALAPPASSAAPPGTAACDDGARLASAGISAVFIATHLPAARASPLLERLAAAAVAAARDGRPQPQQPRVAAEVGGSAYGAAYAPPPTSVRAEILAAPTLGAGGARAAIARAAGVGLGAQPTPPPPAPSRAAASTRASTDGAFAAGARASPAGDRTRARASRVAALGARIDAAAARRAAAARAAAADAAAAAGGGAARAPVRARALARGPARRVVHFLSGDPRELLELASGAVGAATPRNGGGDGGDGQGGPGGAARADSPRAPPAAALASASLYWATWAVDDGPGARADGGAAERVRVGAAPRVSRVDGADELLDALAHAVRRMRAADDPV
ncbi:hypothetical protein KFE25_010451 [Diacronema lutheri]|uniref:Uncharacterized protein n=1 Tax=Diacronema lutheri TaxID=2081491 RepID=A0A8J6C413_DIALT|nr:hypothetical protein KFE25_010451 [Diacronema lutheri]